ncbi:hypothetical protein EKI60_06550 [Candidatus Saccharibacteria bacterium]|nr:MAG: hypothetical protein EKI60_06550 [Candidatus Saccharibacteria bacterium]
MNKTSELVREKLIEELDQKFGHIFLTCTHHDEMLADFILARDKKNAEPLVEYRSKKYGCSDKGIMDSIEHNTKAINATLKNLGVDNE